MRFARALTRAGQLSNVVGGVVIFVFLAFVSPIRLQSDELSELRLRNGIAVVVYMLVTIPGGQRFMRRRYFDPMTRWLREGRSATEDERRMVLGYPLVGTAVSGIFWGGGAILFAFLNTGAGADVAAAIAVGVTLGGMTACALQYLFAERALREATALALAGAPPRLQTPGVTVRLLMVWLLATGVPLLGALAVAAGHLLGAGFSARDTLEASLFLGCLAFVIGFAGLVVTAKSIAEPLASLRGAVERLQRGDFDARVPVDDGSEVGLLQAGFNRMAAGLGERERLREAFGAYVDPDLAERVLAEGTDLAGEELEVSIMFMDIRGFTSYAEQAGAREVVSALNNLYGAVVPVIRRHRGHPNKFIGDGLLAVFGAPERLEDHAARAVAAAQEIAALVRDRDGLAVGVGVNSGAVMAGTIGGGGRLDFTVIGDAVNTAARVEAATRQTGDDVLITEATLSRLGSSPGEWEERRGVELKGKARPVRLFAPLRPRA